jgi:pyrrolidone-carboxylate peptidase
MSAPLVLVAGFGPYYRTGDNPSGHVALALEREPVAGLDVLSAVLPVAFGEVGAAWDALIARAGERKPALLLGLGMHGGANWRIEQRARGRMTSLSLDNAGVEGSGVELGGGEERENWAEWEEIAEGLRAAGAGEVVVSRDAGGFVCEASYHYLIGRARELEVPCLFLHVPDGARVPWGEQLVVVRGFLEGWGRGTRER